jgi:hypothetical protein
MTNHGTAAERCEYCGRAIWADDEQELFVDARGEADCTSAPLVTNPAGAQYAPILGIHEPA